MPKLNLFLQNAKTFCNFVALLKPYDIGARLNGVETGFQVVPLFLKLFHFWVSFITFCNILKIPSVFNRLITAGWCFRIVLQIGR
jgi:hypothetical protein